MNENTTPNSVRRCNPWITAAISLLLLCAVVPKADGEPKPQTAPNFPLSEQPDGHLKKSPWAQSIPNAPEGFSWMPLDTHFGLLFPALELARLGLNEKRTAKDTGPNALGAFPNSPYSAAVHLASDAKVKVRLEMHCDELMEPSAVEVTVEKAGQYAVIPAVKWKAGALRACTQRHEVEIHWILSVNGGLPTRATQKVTVQPVSIFPLFYIFTGRKTAISLSHYAAAYVDENHPKLAGILKEALEMHVIDQFTGLESNDPAKVKDQVFAIWWALQRRGIVYDNIARVDVGVPDGSAFVAQRVRLFEDVIEAKKANCIDGTFVFASLLRHIGMDPVICLPEDHAFLGFYLDKEKKKPVYLEPTSLNNPGFYVAAKERVARNKGRLAKDLFPEPEAQISTATPELARAMFDIAMEEALREAEEADKDAKAGKSRFERIDVVEQRKTIAPIPSLK